MSLMADVVPASDWYFGIHDNTFVGWLTVAGYILATGLALACALTVEQVGPERHVQRYRQFWWVVTLAMFALGINKQLDFHVLFAQEMRNIAREESWYEDRRIYQFWFVVLLGITSVVALTVMGYLMRGLLKRTGIAVTGLVVLAAYVLLRASSFHHVDSLFFVELGPLRLRWIIELFGVGLVVAGSASNLIWGRERRIQHIEDDFIQQELIEQKRPTHAAGAFMGEWQQSFKGESDGAS